MTMDQPGHDGVLGGPEVPADALDLVAALRRHLTANPSDTAALTAVRQLAEDGQKAHDTRPLAPLTWRTAPRPEPRRWLVHEWLPMDAITLLTGPGGIGKSRLALQLAAGVASGGEMDRWIGGWTSADYHTLTLGNGVPVGGGPVLYATWEDSPGECFRRLAELSGEAAPWVTPDRLDALYIVDMAGRGPLWGPDIGRHIQSTAGLLATGQRLRELAEDLGAVLVVLDPLAAAYAGDENARALVRAFMADGDAWARLRGLSILMLAHPPKSGANYAGSTDWQAAARAMWQLDKAPVGKAGKRGDDDRPVGWRLEMVKSNYGPIPPALRLEWDTGGSGLRWQVAGTWGTEPWVDQPEYSSNGHGNGHGNRYGMGANENDDARYD